MKVRTGFVSNSSSSSFVALVEKEAHEQALQSLPELYRELILENGLEEVTFCGISCISVHGNTHDEGANINGEEMPALEEWNHDLCRPENNKRFLDAEGCPLTHDGEVLEGSRHLVGEYWGAIEKLPEGKRHIKGQDF